MKMVGRAYCLAEALKQWMVYMYLWLIARINRLTMCDHN